MRIESNILFCFVHLLPISMFTSNQIPMVNRDMCHQHRLNHTKTGLLFFWSENRHLHNLHELTIYTAGTQNETMETIAKIVTVLAANTAFSICTCTYFRCVTAIPASSEFRRHGNHYEFYSDVEWFGLCTEPNNSITILLVDTFHQLWFRLNHYLWWLIINRAELHVGTNSYYSKSMNLSATTFCIEDQANGKQNSVQINDS